MTSILSFFLLCTRKHKNGKTKIELRFIFVRFLYEQTPKTEKRQMTSFLSFFLLCTKTHKFLYFKYLFFVFYGFLSEPRAGTERGSRGGGGVGLVGAGCSFRKLVYVLLVSSFYNRGMRLFSRVLQKWREWKT